MRSCDTQETSRSVGLLGMDFITLKLAESATRSSGRSSVAIMTILLIAFASTTTHDATFVYQHVFHAGLYFRVRRIMLKVWILVKSVPKIGCQVSQPPQAFNRREQEQCFLRTNAEGGNICPASGVFSILH